MEKPTQAALTEQQWAFLLRKLSQARADVSLFIKENIDGIDCGTTKAAAGPVLTKPPAVAVKKILKEVETKLGWAVAGMASHAEKAYPRIDLPFAARWKPEDPLK